MNREIPSNLHPRNYALSEVCRILNRRQATLYIKHNVYPIDIYHSFDKDGNDILIYTFLKEECKDVFERWNEHTLE